MRIVIIIYLRFDAIALMRQQRLQRSVLSQDEGARIDRCNERVNLHLKFAYGRGRRSR